MRISDTLMFVPQAGLEVSCYVQDSHRDKSNDGSVRHFNEYTCWLYTSSVGAGFDVVGHIGSVPINLRLLPKWIHEFNADNDNVKYTSTSNGSLVIRSPVEDIFEMSVCTDFDISSNSVLRILYAHQLGSEYSAQTISMQFVWRF